MCCRASNFLPRVPFTVPPCPTPASPPPGPHCQALERSRISVSFDYRGWMGDVSRAWRSLLMSWQTGASLRKTPPAPARLTNQGAEVAHGSCWFLIDLCVSLGGFLVFPPSAPLPNHVCSSSAGGFRFGRFMELAQGSRAQGWEEGRGCIYNRPHLLLNGQKCC